MSTLAFGQRYEPGYGRSFALAFAIHAVLIAVMFFGVRMQSYQPETVSVELWEPPPPPLPAPVVEPPKLEPRPAPKVEPEPPKPEPKIEKPEIVEKPAPKPKPKAEPKPKPKPPPPVAKPKPAPRDLELEKRAQAEVAREQSEFRDRQMKEQAAREQASLRDKALALWVDKIRLKIRSRILESIAAQVEGNPEAVYQVALLPSGDVLTARLTKSSGNKAYDDELGRAILAASPLPKPEPQSLFQRQLELRFRPKDK